MAFKSQTDREKEQTRKRKFGGVIALFLIITMIASSIGFYYASPSQEQQKEQGQGELGQEQPTYDYNGQKFTYVNNKWTFFSQIGTLGTVALTFLPNQVSEIICNCNGLSLESLQAEKAYFVANTFYERQAAQELLGNLQYNKLNPACLPDQAELAECVDLPLKSCDGGEDKVFVFAESQEVNGKAEIRYLNNCLIVKSKPEDLVKASDRALYSIFGVLK